MIEVPKFLYGSSDSVRKSSERLAKQLLKGATWAELPETHEMLDLSTTPGVLGMTSPAEGHEIFHLYAPLGVLSAQLQKKLDKADDATYTELEALGSRLYLDVLTQPWGMLCALPYENFVWLLASPLDDTVYQDRVNALLRAAGEHWSVLEGLEGRFKYASNWPNSLWSGPNTLSWILARRGMGLTQPPTQEDLRNILTAQAP